MGWHMFLCDGGDYPGKIQASLHVSRAQQYSSNAAMANSNESGSPDAATCLSGKRVRIRQSLRVDVAVPGDGHTPIRRSYASSVGGKDIQSTRHISLSSSGGEGRAERRPL